MKNKNLIIILSLIFLILLVFNINKKIKLESFIKDIIYYKDTHLKDNKFNKEYNLLKEELDNKNEEIKELKKLLDIKPLSEYKLVYATVINRNSKYFYDELIINKGEKDNIREISIVITKDNLIGKIIKVNNNDSIVKLITNKDIYSMLSVQINMKDKYIYGILKSYDENSNSFLIEGIDENVNIEINSNVTTTGLGLYPSGVLIGRVVRIQKDNFDLSSIVKVEPYINFDNIRYVGVLVVDV